MNIQRFFLLKGSLLFGEGLKALHKTHHHFFIDTAKLSQVTTSVVIHHNLRFTVLHSYMGVGYPPLCKFLIFVIMYNEKITSVSTQELYVDQTT